MQKVQPDGVSISHSRTSDTFHISHAFSLSYPRRLIASISFSNSRKARRRSRARSRTTYVKRFIDRLDLARGANLEPPTLPNEKKAAGFKILTESRRPATMKIASTDATASPSSLASRSRERSPSHRRRVAKSVRRVGNVPGGEEVEYPRETANFRVPRRPRADRSRLACAGGGGARLPAQRPIANRVRPREMADR